MFDWSHVLAGIIGIFCFVLLFIITVRGSFKVDKSWREMKQRVIALAHDQGWETIDKVPDHLVDQTIKMPLNTIVIGKEDPVLVFHRDRYAITAYGYEPAGILVSGSPTHGRIIGIIEIPKAGIGSFELWCSTGNLRPLPLLATFSKRLAGGPWEELAPRWKLYIRSTESDTFCLPRELVQCFAKCRVAERIVVEGNFIVAIGPDYRKLENWLPFMNDLQTVAECISV